jgi:ribonuclease P protein component
MGFGPWFLHDSPSMLAKLHRLSKRKDFEFVFKRGRVVTDRTLFLKYAKTKADQPLRATFVVSAKTEKSAVKRNRARRQAREAFRSLMPHLPAGYDFIFTIKPPFLTLPYAEKAETIKRLLTRARLL